MSDVSERIRSEDMGMALGVGACCLLIFWLPWIVLDFYFANGESACLTQEITEYNISFTLDTWLKVQASIMIFLSGLILVGGCVACFVPFGALLGGCGVCLLNFYPLFSMPWTIVGAVMFWGELDPAGTCEGDLTVYMYINLILGCFAIFSCCCTHCVPKANKENQNLQKRHSHDSEQDRIETSPIV